MKMILEKEIEKKKVINILVKELSKFENFIKWKLLLDFFSYSS